MEKSSFVVIEGINYYAEPFGSLTLAELDALEVTDDAVLHVTRHLTMLSPVARTRLKMLNITNQPGLPGFINDDYLDVQLQAAGSKFHPTLSDPWQIIEVSKRWLRLQLLTGITASWLRNPQTGDRSLEVIFSIATTQLDEVGLSRESSLGTCNIFPITPELESRVIVEERGKGEAADRIQVKVIYGMEPPLSNELVIDLTWPVGAEHPRLGSLFTGIRTPAFPDRERQGDEAFFYSKHWWDRHAFLR